MRNKPVIMTKENIRYILLLGAVICCAAFVFFFRLGSESLLTDEYLSLHEAVLPAHDIIFAHRSAANPNTMPPLYELILHFWLKIFGVSEYGQRSLSAFCGVISVCVLYALVRILIDRRTAVLSCLFAVFSFSWFFCFRQNRAYGLMILLTLTVFYCVFRYLTCGRSRAGYIGLVAANTALLFTHYFAVLVIILEYVIAFLYRRERREEFRDIMLMPLWVFLLFLPWVPNMLYDCGREPVVFYKTVALNFTRQAFDFFMILFFDFHLRWQPLLPVIYVSFAVRGLARLRSMRGINGGRAALILCLIFILPTVIIYAVTLSNRPRYYCPFYFPLSVLLAVGVQGWWLKGRRTIAYPAIFSVILVLNLSDLCEFYHASLYENWKKAANHIRSIPDYRNKEMIFVFQTRYNPPVFAYYFWNNRLASLFGNKIAAYEGYEQDLVKLGITRFKVYFIQEENLQRDTFFSRLSAFPDDAWIWVFRYHDLFFYNQFRVRNKGRYFIQQIKLNQEIPQIDFYLIRKM